MFIGGLSAPTESSYSQSSNATVFLEEQRFSAEHHVGDGIGFETGAQWNAYRHLGLAASLTATRRSSSATYSLSVPHPLYFDRAREAAGTTPTREWEEVGSHLAIVVFGSVGRLELSAFAGLSWTRVSRVFVTQPAYGQEYPYDTITIDPVAESLVNADTSGWHVGAGLGVRLKRPFELAARIRYAPAMARPTSPDGTSVEMSVGGLQLSAGVGLRF